MLRYYEQLGLLSSKRKEDYAYRIYDETAVRRLQQIIVLRKLRIPLKQIALIFDDTEQARMIEIFHENIAELDQEITALTTIRGVLQIFLTRLNEHRKANIKLDLLQDNDMLKLIETLTLSKIYFKEERSMDELNKASETLSVLKNVRILYLPAATVAASHYIGENPEDAAGKLMDEFVKKVNLLDLKPDLRMYGFNNPSPQGNETYGYEFWVTIPDDMEVPAPLQKKHFEGGLYAAHCIKMGDFHEWQLLGKWVENSTEYEYDAREPFGMSGCLEEHLNAYSYYHGDEKATEFIQLDLLSPIKLK
jgi:DNA-binding transcriptional MerR regulator